MDKNKLYYIVEKDTNQRINESRDVPLIISSMTLASQRADESTKTSLFDTEYEAISISDYEETYSDAKPETVKSSMWEEFYWKEKFKAAEHESSYWFKRKEREGRKS